MHKKNGFLFFEEAFTNQINQAGHGFARINRVQQNGFGGSVLNSSGKVQNVEKPCQFFHAVYTNQFSDHPRICRPPGPHPAGKAPIR